MRLVYSTMQTVLNQTCLHPDHDLVTAETTYVDSLLFQIIHGNMVKFGN